MIVLDTCAVLWWVFEKEAFSKKSLVYINNMEQTCGYVSSISIWEIGIKIKRKKLELPISAGELSRRLKESGIIKIVPVDEKIWLNSLELKWKHEDPADRVIVATAIGLNVPLITSDKKIRKYFKQALW